jgi:hypothetical protein
MRRHLLAIAGILTVVSGCDNVTWGGAQLELRPPPALARDSAAAGTGSAEATEEASRGLPTGASGPLLLAGAREGARGTFVVVGEVDGDGLRAPDASPGTSERVRRLASPGSRWTLFAEGTRVGTFLADGVSQASEYCPVRPTLTGVIELVPTASAAERFLALPAEIAGSRAYETYSPLNDVYEQRVATLAWAGEAIARYRATPPPQGFVAARQDIRAFRTPGSATPLVAATFMHRDELSVGPPRSGAYALFVLGSRTGDQYREDFAWYRPADTEGKGAPRYFDHLDWDADGDSEVVLDVFGTSRRWFAALAMRSGQWTRTYQDACEAAATTGG